MAEKPGVSAIINRLRESALDKNSITNRSRCCTEEEKRREVFPWIEKFHRQTRRQLGSINIAMLENLMSNYLGYITTSSVECYNKPNRAGRLKTMINETLFLFHTIYTEIKQPLEHSSYLDKMSELLAFYIDMEIKASKRGRENISKIGSKITTALYSYLDRSQDHILDTILRTKLMMAKCYWELCVPIFNRVLTVPTNHEMTDLSYARFIFVFKMWKKCMKKAEDKLKINKIAENRLVPPQSFQIAVKSGAIKGVLPKIPKSKPDVTMFLMQTKFCVKTNASMFLKTVSHPIHRVIMNDHKPLFFEDNNDTNVNKNDDEDDEESCDELMDDILSSLRTKASSRDLNRMANVVKSPAKKSLKTTKNLKKKKKKMLLSNNGNVADNLKVSPKNASDNSFVSKMISRSNLLRSEKETMPKVDDEIIILDEIKTEQMSPIQLSGCSNENSKDLDESNKTVPNDESYVKVDPNIEECFIKKEAVCNTEKNYFNKTCANDVKNVVDPTDLSRKDLSTPYEIFNFEPTNDTISPTKIEQELLNNVPNVLIDKQNDNILCNSLPTAFVNDNFTRPVLFRESHDMTNYDWYLPVCSNNSELINYQMNALPPLHEEKSNTIDYDDDDENMMKNYGLSSYDAHESPVKSIASLQNWEFPKQESKKFLTPAQRKEVLIHDSPPEHKKNIFDEKNNGYVPLDQTLVSAPMIHENKSQNSQQIQQSPFKPNALTTFDSKYLKTTSGLSGFSLDYIFDPHLPNGLDCSQTFQNKPYAYEPDFNDRVGGTTETDKPASPKNHEVDYFSDFIESAQADPIPSPSLSTPSGSVYQSDYNQVNAVPQTEICVPDPEDEKTEGTWLHSITSKRDGYVFLLQQKTRKLLFESVHLDISSPPEEFQLVLNRRCICDSCKLYFASLWSNFCILSHHRKIQAMFGENYSIKTLCFEDEKLFVQMEYKIKDYILKEFILINKIWLSLPIKKRTATRHEQLANIIRPNTPTFWIDVYQDDQLGITDYTDIENYYLSFVSDPNAHPSKKVKTPNPENSHLSTSLEGDLEDTPDCGRYDLRSSRKKPPILPKKRKCATKPKTARKKKRT